MKNTLAIVLTVLVLATCAVIGQFNKDETRPRPRDNPTEASQQKQGNEALSTSKLVDDCKGGTRYVKVDVLNVRSHPVNGEIVGRVRKGTPIKVLECRGEWVRIETSKWVHAAFLTSKIPITKRSYSDSDKAVRFRQLRDEGIRLLGWVAGNSFGHPIWQQVKQYVGKGGEYYEFFLGLAPPGLSKDAQQAEAFHNVSLYDEWFQRGQKKPFDEIDNMNKIKKLQQLADQAVGVYR